MKKHIQLLFALSIGLHTGFSQNVYCANSDILDVDPGLQAKIAREKLKQTRASSGGDAGGASNNGCGQIDIGNDDSSKRGSNQVSQRDKTVIVTGPVINATKCQ